MKLKRIARDVVVLGLFCGFFYTSTIVVGQFEKEEELQKKTNFTQDRLEGDRLARDNNWFDSAKYYQKIIETDPYNGFAWNQLARCYSHIRIEKQQEIVAEQNLETPSEAKIGELQEIVKDHEQLAIDAWNEVREHPRHRRAALFNLAVIYSDRDKYEDSLACLEEFVDRGFYVNDLSKFRQFGESQQVPASRDQNRVPKNGTKLHQFEKFWEITQRESDIRRENVRKFQIRPSSFRGSGSR